MSDWPGVLQFPFTTVINGIGSPAALSSDMVFTPSGAVWPAANRAIYLPFILETQATAYQMGFEVVTQSGNCDVGIYDEAGARLVSKGSTAVAAAGKQLVDIADTVLAPGLYFMAMCVDNVTASFRAKNSGTAAAFQVFGVQQQAVGAVTLPNPATFANPAGNYCPVLVVAFTATM